MCGWLRKLQDTDALASQSETKCSVPNSNSSTLLTNFQCGKNTNDVPSAATVIIFFVSRNITTPKATRLGETKVIWAEKFQLPTSSDSSGEGVFQAFN